MADASEPPSPPEDVWPPLPAVSPPASAAPQFGSLLTGLLWLDLVLGFVCGFVAQTFWSLVVYLSLDEAAAYTTDDRSKGLLFFGGLLLGGVCEVAFALLFFRYARRRLPIFAFGFIVDGFLTGLALLAD